MAIALNTEKNRLIFLQTLLDKITLNTDIQAAEQPIDITHFNMEMKPIDLAYLYFFKDNYPAASAIIDDIRAQDDNNDEANQLYIMLQIYRNDIPSGTTMYKHLRDAEASLEKLKNKDDIEFYYRAKIWLLDRMIVYTFNTEEAKKLIQQSLRLTEKLEQELKDSKELSYFPYLKKAILYSDLIEYETNPEKKAKCISESINQCKIAYKLSPRSSEIWNQILYTYEEVINLAYSEKERVKMINKIYDKLKDLPSVTPNNSAILQNLAWLLMKKSQFVDNDAEKQYALQLADEYLEQKTRILNGNNQGNAAASTLSLKGAIMRERAKGAYSKHEKILFLMQAIGVFKEAQRINSGKTNGGLTEAYLDLAQLESDFADKKILITKGIEAAMRGVEKGEKTHKIYNSLLRAYELWSLITVTPEEKHEVALKLEHYKNLCIQQQ